MSQPKATIRARDVGKGMQILFNGRWRKVLRIEEIPYSYQKLRFDFTNGEFWSFMPNEYVSARGWPD